MAHFLYTLRHKTVNLSKAHEKRDSVSIFLFAGCPGLSLAMSVQFMHHSQKLQKTDLKH